MATMIHLLWVVLMLSWSLEDVNSQTFPYVSFIGQTLANHSYVNLSLVGYDRNDSVQCHSDLDTCCTINEGSHRGDWYFPRLPFYRHIYENRGVQRVALNRSNNAISPVGIYRCSIATVVTSVRATVYVGLYTSGGRFSANHA